MRLDKFLKVSRLIKRRTVAKEVADQGRIKINDTVAKSSSTVKIGDILEIRFGNRIMTVEVLDIRDTTKKNEAVELYKIISEERIEKEIPIIDEFLS
ncbi:RNA-binding S4 domain-containing protein [Globicatella sanguinis]